MKLLSIFQRHTGRFYVSFEEAADNNVKAARALLLLCKNPKDSAKITKKIRSLEHAGDEIAHGLFDELHRTFVPPPWTGKTLCTLPARLMTLLT